jgi:hypothetical protein
LTPRIFRWILPSTWRGKTVWIARMSMDDLIAMGEPISSPQNQLQPDTTSTDGTPNGNGHRLYWRETEGGIAYFNWGMHPFLVCWHWKAVLH